MSDLSVPNTDPAAPLLDRAGLEHLAHLARLELRPDELGPMVAEMNELLGYFRQLQAVDTAGVPPMQRPARPAVTLRPDEPGAPLPQAEVLALAPQSSGGLVVLPRTLEGDG